jgi:hypothetical protein
VISSILKITILNKPANDLVGLKWEETREMFGKEAMETIWITDSVDNNCSPQYIYEIIKPTRSISMEVVQATGIVVFPDAPKSGWENKKLSAVCSDYGLNLDEIIKKLGDKKINAKVDTKIKEIAADNDLDLMGVFEALHEIVTADNKPTE